jgi:hypothetical protein
VATTSGTATPASGTTSASTSSGLVTKTISAGSGQATSAAAPMTSIPPINSGGPEAESLLTKAKDMEAKNDSSGASVTYEYIVNKYANTVEAGEAQAALNHMAELERQVKLAAEKAKAEAEAVASAAKSETPDTPKTDPPEAAPKKGADKAITPPPPRNTPQAKATPPVADKIVLRINCGGKELRDKQGNVWQADQGYGPDSKAGFKWGFKDGAAVDHPGDNIDTSKIEKNDFPEPFKYERFNVIKGYQFDLPKGVYTVRLGFCENNFTAGGKRVFGVKMNNVVVIPRMDVWRESGGKDHALVKVFPNVNIVGGSLAIEFIRITENPEINCIEILQQQ